MQEGKQLLVEINEARARPQECIQDIKQQLARFESNNVMRTRKGDKLRVTEGKSAWQQAILFLERSKPKQPLTWSKELAETAQAYLSVRTSSDPNPFKLLKSKYSYQASISFNVNESEVAQTLRQLVIAMIVGDGDQKKGNRTTLFHPTFSHFGAIVQKDKQGMFVPMFFSQTGKFQPKPSAPINSADKSQTVGNRTVYTDRGKQFIAELNRIRKDPKSIIGLLKSDIDKFKDQKTLVKDNVIIKTKQGKIGYQDLIAELEQQYPIPLLKVSEGLCMAAADQVVELQQEKEGIEAGTNYVTFVKRYCSQNDGINNIIMNRSEDDTYINMLVHLLVGDGDKKRSARRKLLSPVLKVIGVSVGENYFVVNIGQSSRDNKEAMESSMLSDKKSKEHPPVSAPSMSKINKPEVPKQVPKQMIPKQESQEQERPIKKKTTKSSTITRNGRHYKKTVTKILYADGQTEQLQEQEMLD